MLKKLDLTTIIIFLVSYIAGTVYIFNFLDLKELNLTFLFENKLELFKIYSVVFFLFLLDYMIRRKRNWRTPGEEKGSARWGTKKEIKELIDKNDLNNIIFTTTEKMSLNTHQTLNNNNVIVIGGSGSGKTRFYAKPNLMQMHSSYVITDPKGELLKTMGKMFEKNGYKIKIFNLINMSKSSKYNPFVYIREQEDVIKLIKNLIKNTNGPNSKDSGDFWEKSEIMLLQAIMFYLIDFGNENEKNFPTLMKLLRFAEAKEEDENFLSPLDLLFVELEEEYPEHIAVLNYKDYKKAAGKTAKSILISISARLSILSTDNVRNILSDDELEIDKVGDEKTAFFLLIPDSNPSYNFLAAILYTQMFDLLYYKADFIGYEENGKKIMGRLKYPVRFILDEFANIGEIPDFEMLISTMRSREISANIIIQSFAQLKEKYKDNFETIIENCDSMIFLGGNGSNTMKTISENLGNETIDISTTGKSRGGQSSSSVNYNLDGRALMYADEIRLLKKDEAILFIRAVRPFRSKKFNLKKHKNYNQTGDFSNDNIFYIDDFNFQKSKKQSNITVEVEINQSDEDKNFNVLVQLFSSIEKELSGRKKFEELKKEILQREKDHKLSRKEILEIVEELKEELNIKRLESVEKFITKNDDYEDLPILEDIV